MKHARKIIPAPVDAGFCSACDEAYEGTHCDYCWDPEDFDGDWGELRSAEDYSSTMRFWGRDPLKPETWA